MRSLRMIVPDTERHPDRVAAVVFAGFAVALQGAVGVLAYEAFALHSLVSWLFLFLALSSQGGVVMLSYESYVLVVVGDPTISSINAFAFSTHPQWFTLGVLLLGLGLGGVSVAQNVGVFGGLLVGAASGGLVVHFTHWLPGWAAEGVRRLARQKGAE
jgi:hypothetical protein